MRIFRTNSVKPPPLPQVQELEVNPYESSETCFPTKIKAEPMSKDVQYLVLLFNLFILLLGGLFTAGVAAMEGNLGKDAQKTAFEIREKIFDAIPER